MKDFGPRKGQPVPAEPGGLDATVGGAPESGPE